MRRFLVIGALFVLGACNATDDVQPEGESENGQFEATVIGVEDCNMVLLEFNREEDVPALQEITDIESSRYFAVNLSKVLLYPGQKLEVVIRKLRRRRTLCLSNVCTILPGFVFDFFPFQIINFSWLAHPGITAAQVLKHVNTQTLKHFFLSFKLVLRQHLSMDYNLVLQNVLRHIALNNKEISYFTSLLHHKEVARKEFLLQAGNVAKHINFIRAGALKAYYLDVKSDKI